MLLCFCHCFVGEIEKIRLVVITRGETNAFKDRMVIFFLIGCVSMIFLGPRVSLISHCAMILAL
jgi:hypothetical protein